MERIRKLVVTAQSGGNREERLAAFEEVVRLMQDMAFGYAYSILGDFHLAEDAVQNSFIMAYRRLEDLREPEAFPGWLRRIVQTTCGQMARRKAVPEAALDDTAGQSSQDEDPAQLAESQEMHEHVLSAIRELPEVEREVTTLFYINGYSQRDIAGFLEIPVTTVKNRLHASRKRLRERMLRMVTDELHTNRPGPEFSASLFNGINLDRWVLLSDGRSWEVKDGELVIEGRLHAEVGGMSWDDYRAGVDVLVEKDSSSGMDLPFNVQLCPKGTSVFCQLVGDNVILAYWDETREKHFTHLASVQRHVVQGIWHHFEIQVEDGGVTIFFNGEDVIRRKIPRGTAGMLGLVVNHGSDARVRLRNIQMTFLKATPQQLKELESDAARNWEEHKRREVTTGKRRSMKDNSL
jgi:RNA polymerase sigma factor (sigma-70 family)